MDSFSELTDQLFLNQTNNSRFLANYGDVDHELLSKDFKCLGLLEESKLFKFYDIFFEKIKQIYPNIPLYFIHFSIKLDERGKFKNRGKVILGIINKLSQKYTFLQSIFIDDQLIEKANSNNEEYNNLPYHYSDDTYRCYVEKFEESLLNATS